MKNWIIQLSSARIQFHLFCISIRLLNPEDSISQALKLFFMRECISQHVFEEKPRPNSTHLDTPHSTNTARAVTMTGDLPGINCHTIWS